MNNTPKTETLSTKVPPRVFILNSLQIIGILAASLAIPSPETAAVLALLPGGIAANVGKIALGLLAAKPGINLLSDWVDNGKLDGSFVAKALAFALIPAFIFGMVSCGPLAGLRIAPPSEDGCFLIQQTKDGKTYSFGPCVNEAGEIVRYRTQWKNADGVTIQATYNIENKVTLIQYKTVDGVWVNWSSKAGISLDGMPPGGHPALAG